MEVTAQAIVKEVALRLHAATMKPRGFKKSAFTWIRGDDWPKVVHLQLSKWNTAAEASFTLNLGVFINSIHNAAGSPPVTGRLKEPDCDVRRRIGRLIPGETDKWWKVTPATDAAALFEDVNGALVGVGLPWFERLHDFPSVAAELASEKIPFKSAIAFKLAGRYDEAVQVMETACANANQLALPKLKRIATELGIPIRDDETTQVTSL